MNRVIQAIAVIVLVAASSQAAAEDTYDGPHFKRAVFVVSDLDRSLPLWRDVLGFAANPINDLTGEDSYVFELMNVPRSSIARSVSFNAGEEQVRTMLLLEVPGSTPLPPDDVHRSTVVINANGRLEHMIDKVMDLGLTVKHASRFVTADGDEAIEQGFVDWDGNLVLLYQISN